MMKPHKNADVPHSEIDLYGKFGEQQEYFFTSGKNVGVRLRFLVIIIYIIIIKEKIFMSNKLNILWVNDNPHTAHSMVFLYAINSITREWWEELDIIIWGATAKLVAEDESIQEKIKMAQHVGIKVRACITCAEMFGVADKLKSLDIEVIGMGVPLTEILKSEEKLITI